MDTALLNIIQLTGIGGLSLILMYFLFKQSLESYSKSISEITNSLKQNTEMTIRSYDISTKIYEKICENKK